MLRGKQQSGQVAILFALIFTFLFILFAFVVNFGHIINDKINLQNAADMAAYTGAAWQARILNQISQVNYHIRQDIKELAMRVHVTHTRHNRNFPRGRQAIDGNAGPPRGYYPFACQQAHGYRSISGVSYAKDTNLCRNASPEFGGLPPIVVPPVIAAFDPFAVAIAAQIRKIQEASDRECKAAADDNRQLIEHLVQVYTKRIQFHMQQVRSLESFLNGVSNENPSTSTHPLVKAAFQSAIRNTAISNRNFKMEILQPEDGEYVRLDEAKMRASFFFYNFTVQGSGCVGQPGFINADDLSTGVSKNRSIVTYFAVKLSNTPDLMFAPARWLETNFPQLQAFAAAKPFGSRIGPETTIDQLLPVPNRPGNNNRLLNFSFKPGDNLGIMNTKVMALLDGLHPYNDVPNPEGNQQRGWPEPGKQGGNGALLAVRAPTIFDALYYTIHPTPGGNINEDYAEPRFAEALFPDYLEASNPDNTLVQTRKQPRTTAYFPADVGSKNNGSGWIQIDADPTQAGGPYAGYAEEGPASHSVVGVGAISEIKGKEAEFGFATRDLIHSGWTPAGKPGRIGYSVKFIPFDALVRSLRIQLGQGREGNIANPPTGDTNVGNILH